jgi:hypothetical protein
MAYQPPGPYPVMPMAQVPGMPQRPPIPPSVLRSYYAILVGAVLSAVGIIVEFTEIGSLRTQIEQRFPNFTASRIDSLVNLEIAAVIVFGVIGVLLWLWMAWKIRTGRHWARVLSSVFFGISVVSALIGGVHMNASETSGAQTSTASVSQPTAGIILGWVSVVVGLYALIMFWRKDNAPFFRPQNFMAPLYPYPYPAPGYPTVPGQGGFAPQDPSAQQPQQPGDPWSTPPQ